MRKLIFILTLALLVLISLCTYTMYDNFAADEDLPRVFDIAEKQPEELNFSLLLITAYEPINLYLG